MELQQLGAIACLPEAAAHELVGLDGFLARVEAVRDQNDHDLDLITRRLQLSCIELSHTNDRLRLELDSHTRGGEFFAGDCQQHAAQRSCLDATLTSWPL